MQYMSWTADEVYSYSPPGQEHKEDEMTDSTVQRQFGAVANAYAQSSYHASGPDLKRLLSEARFQGTETVLDLGSGAGHTALACATAAASVVGVDVTPEMVAVATSLAAERGLQNVSFRLANVEALPFEDASFDVVTSRVSAHHYANPAAALAEARRVLKPGGTLFVADSVAPEDPYLDTFLNCIELLRDSSHVRGYRLSEWAKMLGDVGFRTEVLEVFPVELGGDDWVRRMQTPPDKVAMLRRLFTEATPAARATFDIRDEPWGFTIPIALIRAN
jgi:ubiquinone/menaquinone biosynthesis C-methylase UbiE